jgi:putative ABC transport system ATP-binding protein
LLRLLNRLDDPTAGEVRFAGQPIAAIPIRELRRRVGFVFQAPVMLPGSVGGNLAIARRLAAASGLTSPDGPLDDEAALELAGLDASFAARDAASLSGGEKQRVSIARALACRPEVLLLDEPTSALDPEVADQLMATIREIVGRGRLSIVMVTHRLDEAREASTVTVVLEAGQLVELGPTEQLFSAPKRARTREYLVGRRQAAEPDAHERAH